MNNENPEKKKIVLIFQNDLQLLPKKYNCYFYVHLDFRLLIIIALITNYLHRTMKYSYKKRIKKICLLTLELLKGKGKHAI